MSNLRPREESKTTNMGSLLLHQKTLLAENFWGDLPSLKKEEEMKTKMEIEEGIQELIQLRDEVVDKLYEMRSIIHHLDEHGMIAERANSYWLPNTIVNLTQDHEWMSRGSMTLPRLACIGVPSSERMKPPIMMFSKGFSSVRRVQRSIV